VRTDAERAFREQLREQGFGCAAEVLVARSREGVALPITAPLDVMTPGVSRLGGPSEVPVGFDFPQGPAGESTFLLQVNLAELPQSLRPDLLPDHGLLSFFNAIHGPSRGGVDDWSAAKVFWFEDPLKCSLVPRSSDSPAYELGLDAIFVPAVDDETCTLAGSVCEFDRETYVQSFYGTPKIAHTQSVVDRISEGKSFLTQFDRSWESWLLGHAHPRQSDKLPEDGPLEYLIDHSDTLETLRDTAQAIARDGILLLQLDSGPTHTWGDVGRMYWFISEQDLRDRRFDRVWSTWDC
jgi:hypothetical protein